MLQTVIIVTRPNPLVEEIDRSMELISVDVFAMTIFHRVIAVRIAYRRSRRSANTITRASPVRPCRKPVLRRPRQIVLIVFFPKGFDCQKLMRPRCVSVAACVTPHYLGDLMRSKISCCVNINRHTNDGDIFSNNSRRLIIVCQQMRTVHKCYMVVVAVPQPRASLHDGLTILLRKFHCEHCPLVKIDRRRLNNRKVSERAILVRSCRV